MSSITFDGREFREIQDTNGYYVSADGDVLATRLRREKRARLLSKTPCNGYRVAQIGGKQQYIHRAVALAWVPNPLCLPVVNHIDGCKSNNVASNLEWVTPARNIEHAFETGLNDHRFRPVVGVHKETGHRIELPSQVAAKELGFDQGAISKCVAGKLGQHHGYVWSLA